MEDLADANVGQQPLSCTSLPDELLVHIFRHLDTISRKRVKSVCSRWRSLLRDTSSLHDHVKLDVSLLPPNEHTEQQHGPNNYETTLKRLLDENPATELVHITDESQLAKSPPGLAPQPEYLVLDKWEIIFVACHLIGRHVDQFSQGPIHLTLEKVAVDFDSLAQALGSTINDGALSCVELRDVTIMQITQTSLILDHYHGHLPHPCVDLSAYYEGPRMELQRRISGSLPLEEGVPYGPYGFMALIGDQEAPLTTDEELIFARVMAAVQLDRSRGAAEHLERMVKDTFQFSLTDMTRGEIVTGASLTPFVKRFLIAAEDILLLIDAHSQPLGAPVAGRILVSGRKDFAGYRRRIKTKSKSLTWRTKILG